MTRPLAIVLSIAAATSGGCMVYTVDARGGTDAMPRELRSSSDDRRPAAGVDAQLAATSQPAGGIFSSVRAVPAQIGEFFKSEDFANVARDFNSDSPDLRRKAIEQAVAKSFGRAEPYTKSYRVAAQFDADGLVRATAVRAISRARDASATGILVAALADGEPRVRLEAAKALCNLPTPEAEVPLRKLAQSTEEDADARVAALDALRHYRSLDTQRALVGQLNGNNFALAWQSRRSLFLQTDADYRYDESAWLNFLTGAAK